MINPLKDFKTHILNIATFSDKEIDFLKEFILKYGDDLSNQQIQDIYDKLNSMKDLRRELNSMGRYYINLSRLDMVLVIQALEDLKEKQVNDLNNKTYRATCVLLDILKEHQDGADPKLDIQYK